MYAVFAHGGKQYRVAAGERVRVERIEAEKGATVEFPDVRLVGSGAELKTGSAAKSARVVGVVVEQDRGPKVIVFKKKRCKQYRRTRGHRQGYTEVRIERIG